MATELDILEARAMWGRKERGKGLKTFRERLGLSARGLAKLSKLSYQLILNAEGAVDYEIKVTTEVRILNALIDEAVRQRLAGARIEPESIYGDVVPLKPLVAPSAEVPVHPLTPQAVRLSLELGRQVESLTPDSALDFADKFQDLGGKLIHAGIPDLAKDCLVESRHLIEWARVRYERLERDRDHLEK
jgi:hypothetical protein